MLDAIKVDKNKIIIDLVDIKDADLEEVLKHIKELVYNNTIAVFYVISDEYANVTDEFYFFKALVETVKANFNTFLMLKTRYFSDTKFFDSVFALGVDALTLSIRRDDEASTSFNKTISYITKLWPSGAIFTDVVAIDCTDDEIKSRIDFYANLKVIPKIIKSEGCGDKDAPSCVRDVILSSLKSNGVSLKWVMNFELCNVILENAKGGATRKIAGRVAFELASLRRKVMVKEVESSFDSASL